VQEIGIPSNEDIALPNSGALTGTVGIHTDDDQTQWLLEPGCLGDGSVDFHRLEAEAQIAAGDPAMGEQLAGDSFDRFRGYDENPAPGPEHGHANDSPAGIEGGAPFRMAIQPEIQVEPAIDAASAQAPPRLAREGNDAQCGAQALGSPSRRKSEVAGPEPISRSEGEVSR